MADCVGVMVMWRTYGSWVAGDERRGRESLCAYRSGLLEKRPVVLDDSMKRAVREALMRVAGEWDVEILALAVCRDHLHVVTGPLNDPIGKVVAVWKTAVRHALYDAGLAGKVWAKGYDKRFCYDDESLRARIDYVVGHEG